MSAKRKRVVLSMSQKLRIIERLDKGEKAVELSAEYSVGKSTIAAIKKSKHELREFVAGMEEYQGTEKCHTMKVSSDENMDKAVFTWFVQERERGSPISGPIVKQKVDPVNLLSLRQLRHKTVQVMNKDWKQTTIKNFFKK